MKQYKLLARASLLVITFSLHSFADDRWLVRVHPSVANDVARKTNLKIDKQIRADGLFVMSSSTNASRSAVSQALKSNALVSRFQPNDTVRLPELASTFSKVGHKFPKSVRATPQIPMAGAPWIPYLTQPANTLLKIPQAQGRYGYGYGVTVAVIDTWIDYKHPVLAPVLDTWNGKDCVTGASGIRVKQETVPWVDQETVPWVDGSGAVVVNQETVPWVDQETVPWVDFSQHNVPAAFGHGTMVAGIVHLVAPGARILPIKAFNTDGSGTIADVIEGIEWAVEHGAKVINMSFSTDAPSDELEDAIKYARLNGVIMVGSTANDGVPVKVYPSATYPVISVSSATTDDYRSTFANYGSDVEVAAFGEKIISTYPHNKYAAGWGTSFATPFVTGTVALMKSVDRNQDANEALGHLQKDAPRVKSPEMRVPRLDVLEAVGNAK